MSGRWGLKVPPLHGVSGEDQSAVAFALWARQLCTEDYNERQIRLCGSADVALQTTRGDDEGGVDEELRPVEPP